MAAQMTVGDAVQRFLAGNLTLGELAEGPRDAWVALRNYVLAIDWAQERWLWALGAFHAALLLFSVLARKRPRAQIALLCFACAGVFGAGRLNEWARSDGAWAAFATRPYFDADGAFVSLVWSAPLAACAMVAVVNLIAETARLTVAAKRAQMQQQQAAKDKKKKKKTQ